MIKSIALFYFSGTGNTQKVAELLVKELVNSAVSVELISMEEQIKNRLKFPDLQSFDMLGLAYPIYGFGTPAIVERFAESFPKGKGKPLFILKTGADFISINDNASTELICELEKRDFNVFYDRVIVMSSNWIIKYKDALIKQLYYCAEKKVAHMCNDILNRKRRRYDTGGFIKSLSMGIASLEKNYGSRQFGISLRPGGSCDLCGICIGNCPVRNIELHGRKIVFGGNCIWCMRCVYNCPGQSIKSKGLNFCIIKGGYDIEKVINDDSIGSEYVTAKTRGYFKHFYKYFNDVSL